MRYTGGNIGHWLAHPLEKEYVRVLDKVKQGYQGFYENRFEVAYLISIDCVKADLDKEKLTITTKGLDALEFFKD